MSLIKFNNPKTRRGVRRIGNIQNKLSNQDLSPDKRAQLSGKLGKLQNRFQNPIQKRIGRIDRKLGRIGEGSDKYNRLTQRRDRLNERLTPYSAPTAPTVSDPLTTDQSADYNSKIEDIMKAMFPQTGAFDPSNYINQEMYDYEMEMGERALKRFQAAKGSRGGGSHAENFRNFTRQLGAETTQRAMDYAQLDADRRQAAANRLYNSLRDEADRASLNKQNNFDNILRTLELQLSQSPLQTGYGASTSIADILGNQASANFDINSQNYTRTPNTPSNYPAYQKPYPTAPDTSMSDYYNIMTGASANNEWYNTLLDAFNMF